MSSYQHVPVLEKECLAILAPAISTASAVMIDATLGLGGHTQAALDAFPQLRVVGLDRDENALALAQSRLAKYGDRVSFVHAIYDQIQDVLDDQELVSVQGILFDLGVSSMQLDNPERGFAYSQIAPLDMRMDQSVGMTAADVVNTYEERALARILRQYGEERFASRIAKAIVRERARKPFTSSEQLVAVVRDAIPAATRRTGGNPAKRTFQALRIEVNDELSVLERAIPAALDCLDLDGRIVVLSYHSLEDRIVKHALREVTKDVAPVDMPIVPSHLAPEFELLTRGSDLATDEEISSNPRSASVRLRAARRVRPAA